MDRSTEAESKEFEPRRQTVKRQKPVPIEHQLSKH